MKNLSGMTLAEIVKENHKTAAVFERHHLDFCCRGKRSLAEACAAMGYAPGTILQELREVMNDTPHADGFDRLPAPVLINHIVDIHHTYVRDTVPQITAYLDKVSSKHGLRHPELKQIFETWLHMSQGLLQHMEKEEQVLFPIISERSAYHNQTTGSRTDHLDGIIAQLETEHDEAGKLMESIRKLTNDYTPPPDACTTYRLSFAALKAFEADLHQHVHLENNLLFPAVAVSERR